VDIGDPPFHAVEDDQSANSTLRAGCCNFQALPDELLQTRQGGAGSELDATLLRPPNLISRQLQPAEPTLDIRRKPQTPVWRGPETWGARARARTGRFGVEAAAFRGKAGGIRLDWSLGRNPGACRHTRETANLFQCRGRDLS